MSDPNETKKAMNLTDPGKIAEAAEKIYEEHHRLKYEPTHSGQFVVIDVKSGEAYHGEFAEEALTTAREQAPHGVFHLIRVGSPGAFRVSIIGQRSTAWNWALRPTG